MGYRADRRSIGGNTLDKRSRVGIDPLGLGQYLYDARELAELTDTEAAARIGVSQSTIWRIEQGVTVDPAFSIIARLAALYGLTLVRVAQAAKLPVTRVHVQQRTEAASAARAADRLARIMQHLDRTQDHAWRDGFIDRMYQQVESHEAEGDPVQ